MTKKILGASILGGGLGGQGALGLNKMFQQNRQKPPPAEQTPDQADAEAAADAIRRRVAARQGRASTITGPLDLSPSMNTTGRATGTGGG